MRKVILVAAAVGLLSLPALAQQTPGGQSAGGPARMGIPGEAQPGARPMSHRQMMKHKKRMSHKAHHHKRMKHHRM